MTEVGSAYVSQNFEVVIKDLHGRDSESPEGVAMINNVAKGNKVAAGVKFNARNIKKGIAVALRVKRDDETLG